MFDQEDSFPLPENEEERLDALRALKVPYTPAEDRFDRITRLATRLLDVPMALVSLVVKSANGSSRRPD